MAHNETFFLPGPAGRLEAILMAPEGPPRAAAVVCHAHPLHGGVMHFKLVFRAAKALQHAGLAVLRFNFRGVGGSQGSHDHGRGEQDDVRAALTAMRTRFPALPLLLGGFSFGSAMSVLVAKDEPDVRALLVMGFPVALGYGSDALPRCRMPRLFVQGGRDEFGDADAIRRLVDPLPEPKQLRVIEGADHFFTGQLEALHDTIRNWAQTTPWEMR